MDTSVISRPVKFYIHQLCADSGYHLEVLPNAIGMDGVRESEESVLLTRLDHDDYDDIKDSVWSLY